MNKYIWFGFLNNGANSFDVQYTFITSFGEFVGMFIFIFTLCSVIANINLKKSKAHCEKNGTGWIILGISVGLLMALFTSFGIQVGIFDAILNDKTLSDTQLFSLPQLNFNPAIVIGSMLKGSNYMHCNSYIPVTNGFIYLIFEFFGAFLGAFATYIFYKRLMVDEELNVIKSCFCTSPSVRNRYANFFNEFFATFIFMIAIIGIQVFANQTLLKILLIGIFVMGIGYAIGGVTGYALNPFRDFVPRLVYAIIYKKNIDWRYGFIPLSAPIFGSIIAFLMMPGWLY